jgi:L-ascorbate metabolism protein UlaG (beta-lactamase superfamily)
MNIKINTHSSIQIDDIAFDPYGITEPIFTAKYVCITHTHFDHLDIESIKNISNKKTMGVGKEFVSSEKTYSKVELSLEDVLNLKPKDLNSMCERTYKKLIEYLK